MVKMTVKEAADKLLEKGVISQDECEHIKKAAIGQKIKDIAYPTLATLGMAGLGYGLLKDILTPIVHKAQGAIAFKKMTEKVPSLAEKDPEQVKDYFNVVQTFSPKAATNPLVAGALVNKMMEFGGVDHKLVQDISSIQSGINQNTAMQAVQGAAAKSLYHEPGSQLTKEIATRAGDVTTTEYEYK